MTPLQVIQLIAILAGAAKDAADIVTDLHKQGLIKDGEPIPAVHLARIKAVMPQIPDEWDIDHENSGG